MFNYTSKRVFEHSLLSGNANSCARIYKRVFAHLSIENYISLSPISDPTLINEMVKLWLLEPCIANVGIRKTSSTQSVCTVPTPTTDDLKVQ